jgi:glyoxylase-like metal-dependent hydrolase (beta-lactamase superfamily II)
MPRLAAIRRFVSSTGVRIYRIACDALPGIPGRVYLLLGAGPPTLIDAGSGEGQSTEHILAGLESIGGEFGEDFKSRQIERILVTHAHIDHIGGLAALVERTGARVGVHPLDRGVVAAWDDRAVPFNRCLRVFLRRAGVPPARHDELIHAFGFTPGRMRSVPVDLTLDENEPLDGLRVIHTPGHSPGHVCFLVGDTLLSGDHILARTIPQQWPESVSPHTGLDRYAESLEKIRGLDGIAVILGGHEPPIYAIRHRIAEILSAQERRLQRVVSLAAGSAQPATIADLTRYLYSRQQGFHELLALTDVGSRVEYLERRGRLEVTNPDELRSDEAAPARYRPAMTFEDCTGDLAAQRGNTA